MKFFVLLALALVGVVAGAQLPDSATQGPNPQDIATPEPEYIDIEEPLPAAAAPAPAPRPVFAAAAAPRPVIAAPIARPIARPVAVAQQTFFQQQPIAQRAQYLPPLVQQQVVPQQQQQLAGHSFNSRSGYQYRRPVYVRRFYRLRRY
ncbi:cyclin-dependent kinase inhibitor 1C [Drosophila miranda]|uniref:cyclin-dependent kinase inhibitor 1C n=1 Tax=Drosophila miranda TaxID=7229 RepID=UPI0007E6CDC6|nr:cyclin-dependent kinase inhibitor 1C [Drosophila miranda]